MANRGETKKRNRIPLFLAILCVLILSVSVHKTQREQVQSTAEDKSKALARTAEESEAKSAEAERRNKVLESFKNEIPDSSVSVLMSGNQTIVKIDTGISTEKKPDNWDEVKADLYDKLQSDPDVSAISLTNGDDYLLTISSFGSAEYDVFAPRKKEEEKKMVSARVEGESRSVSLPADTYVWISTTGSKFHRYNDCGNMNPKKALYVTVEEAVGRNLNACSRCY